MAPISATPGEPSMESRRLERVLADALGPVLGSGVRLEQTRSASRESPTGRSHVFAALLTGSPAGGRGAVVATVDVPPVTFGDPGCLPQQPAFCEVRNLPDGWGGRGGRRGSGSDRHLQVDLIAIGRRLQS